MSREPGDPAPPCILMGLPTPGAPGGPPGHLPRLVRGLRDAGATVLEETYGGPGTPQSWPARAGTVLGAARRLSRRRRGDRPDLIHLNTAFDLRALLRDWFVVTWLRRSGTRQPILLKMHGSDHRLLGSAHPLVRLLRAGLFARTTRIGVLSEEERINFVAAGVAQDKLRIVCNIVEVDDFATDPGFRARVGLDAETPLLFFAARFVPTKGLVDLLRACAELRDRGQPFCLVCAGDGPERPRAEALTRELDLGARVRFLGYRPEEDLAPFYANATMTVYPTFHIEGFPMTVFRSVAAGTPLITTRIRAAADYLNEPDHCLWVEARKPEALAERILRLIGDAALRAKMARNNRRLARRFSTTRVSADMLEIYRDALGEGPQRKKPG